MEAKCRGPQRVEDPRGARLIEDFRPISECLEWRVSELYWRLEGVKPFIRKEVPYRVNNSGRLSEDAARLLLANLRETRPSGVITVVEHGAGTGLFALHFLDAFRALCDDAQEDFYERLQFVVTDGSPATLEQWGKMKLFESHRGHVRAHLADARSVLRVETGVRAVFCNYLLCVLPAALVRKTTAGVIEQLCIRTELIDDSEVVRSFTGMCVDDIRAVAVSGDSQDLEKLFPLLTLFDYQMDFRVDGVGQIPGVSRLATDLREGEAAAWNFGAFEYLSGVAQAISDDGFILINDYGVTRSSSSGRPLTAERFGVTSAMGVNFPVLEDTLVGQALTVSSPVGDDEQAVHSRLVTRRELRLTALAFGRLFDSASGRRRALSLRRSRENLKMGRLREGLESYRAALLESPRDWALLGEAAMVANQAEERDLGLEWVGAALRLNRWYSAWLWNIRGDLLYSLARFGEAHEAYVCAQGIDPSDPQTNLNLAYTFIRRGELGPALRGLTAGLEGDVKGGHRDALLEMQRHVLNLMSAKRAGEQLRLARRLGRFCSAGG